MSCKSEFKRQIHRWTLEKLLKEWALILSAHQDEGGWEEVLKDIEEVAAERGLNRKEGAA